MRARFTNFGLEEHSDLLVQMSEQVIRGIVSYCHGLD